MVKVRLTYDAQGYIDGWGTDYTEDTVVDLPQSELDTIALDATKLVDGHLVVDQDRLSELKAEMNKPTISEQEQINIELTKELATTKAELDTAHDGVVALTRMIANLKGGS